jgi:hypothetical protein
VETPTQDRFPGTSNGVQQFGDLFASVVLGVAVYGETLSKTGGAHTGGAVIGLVVAIGGVVLLAGSAAPEAVKPGTAAAPT